MRARCSLPYRRSQASCLAFEASYVHEPVAGPSYG